MIRLLARAMLVLVIHIAWAVTGQAQTFQLDPTGVGGDARDGVAVDGSTVVIGKPLESAVYVYVRQSGTWTLQQRIASSLDRAGFGRRVDVSGDTLAVASGTEGSPLNSVSIYVRSGATWTFQAFAVSGVETEIDAAAGFALRLNGNTLIVGDPGGGRIFIAERVGASWTSTQLPSEAPLGEIFGWDVDVRGDVACATAPNRGGGPGTVVFYRRVAGAWMRQQTVAGTQFGAGFGYGCAIDGDTAAVLQLEGPAHVLTRSVGPGGLDVWTTQQLLTNTSGNTNDRWIRLVGNDVFLSGSQVIVFRRAGSVWSEVQRFGISFPMDSDGTTVVARDQIYSSLAAPTGPPGAPTSFDATVSGRTVTFTWGAPTSGAPPTGYTLVARLAAGGPMVATLPMGAGTSFGATAPNGTYVVSVRATNESGEGPESATRTIIVPQAAPLPGPPVNLVGTVTGTTVSFSWSPPVSGGATSYVLLAGMTPSFAVPLANLPLSSTTTSFSGVPPGTYYARVLAQNAGGTGGPSNEVAVTVAAPSPPGTPSMNAPVVSGNTLTLSWNPGSGSAPTGYVLVAAMSPGGASVATVPLTSTSVSFPGVPTGTFFVRVSATNAAGTSPPSPEVTVVVP